MSNELLETIFHYIIVFHVLVGIVFACIYFIIVSFKTEELKRQFLSNLSLEERKLIDKYTAINYFSYRKQLKRVKKNLTTKNDE